MSISVYDAIAALHAHGYTVKYWSTKDILEELSQRGVELPVSQEDAVVDLVKASSHWNSLTEGMQDEKNLIAAAVDEALADIEEYV